MNAHKENTAAATMTKVTAGALLGLGLGLLLAPKKGSDTRSDIKDAGERLRQRLEDTTNRLREKTRLVANRAENRFHDSAEDIEDRLRGMRNEDEAGGTI